MSDRVLIPGDHLSESAELKSKSERMRLGVGGLKGFFENPAKWKLTDSQVVELLGPEAGRCIETSESTRSPACLQKIGFCALMRVWNHGGLHTCFADEFAGAWPPMPTRT
jgi:hypothetical protein